MARISTRLRTEVVVAIAALPQHPLCQQMVEHTVHLFQRQALAIEVDHQGRHRQPAAGGGLGDVLVAQRAGVEIEGLQRAAGGVGGVVASPLTTLEPGVWALAADTDGIDGVEDNAGALVAPDTLARAAALGLKVGDHLSRNDAYGYFQPLGELVMTGPTHTNVNDFRALLVT